MHCIFVITNVQYDHHTHSNPRYRYQQRMRAIAASCGVRMRVVEVPIDKNDNTSDDVHAINAGNAINKGNNEVLKIAVATYVEDASTPDANAIGVCVCESPIYALLPPLVDRYIFGEAERSIVSKSDSETITYDTGSNPKNNSLPDGAAALLRKHCYDVWRVRDIQTTPLKYHEYYEHIYNTTILISLLS